MVYEYDFGDGWTHAIEIDDVLDEEEPRLACLDARACPPEDCGGVDGYRTCSTFCSIQPMRHSRTRSNGWDRPSSLSASICDW